MLKRKQKQTWKAWVIRDTRSGRILGNSFERMPYIYATKAECYEWQDGLYFEPVRVRIEVLK